MPLTLILKRPSAPVSHVTRSSARNFSAKALSPCSQAICPQPKPSCGIILTRRTRGGHAYPSKSLMRMLGLTGNPRADNLFVFVRFLQHREGVSLEEQHGSPLLNRRSAAPPQLPASLRGAGG
jgi:hypothetical protein